MLVEADSLRLAHVADEVLRRVELPRARVDHEAFLAELELRSGPCATVAGAVEQLGEGRAAARAAGATLLAVGLHPDAEFGDVVLTPGERYDRVGGEMRGLLRRTPECALHVHVGMPDADAACAALNGLREALPLIQGLGASSPFWFGVDSGMASARAAIVRSYPGRGVPPPLRSYDDYLEALAAVAAGGGPRDSDHTMIWWDVRLQPRLGTVELRELDVQARLEDTLTLAALVVALALRAVEEPPERPAPAEAIAWSSFNAARDGQGARILHAGRLTPLREVARKLVRELGGGTPELEGIERMLREPDGPARQRAARARGGLRELLDHLAREAAT